MFLKNKLTQEVYWHTQYPIISTILTFKWSKRQSYLQYFMCLIYLIYSISCVLYNHVTCYVCRNHNPALSSIMTCHRVCSKSVTCGVKTASPSGVHEFTPVGLVHITRSLVFCVMFCRSLFVLLYFFDLRLLNPLVSSNFSYDLRLLNPLVSSNFSYDLRLLNPLVSSNFSYIFLYSLV